MIPYLEHPTLDLGFYTIEAFRTLVLVAIIVQFEMTVRRAPRFDIPRETASALVGWAIGLGLVSAHVFDVVTYFPEKLVEDPLEIFRVWGSLSSTGGMLGGLAGLAFVARRRGLSGDDLLGFVDVVIFALPFTLAIGRLGCGLQHDHLGVPSTSPLAVAFPAGPRFDLGLLEFFWVTGIAITFLVLDRAPRRPGFWLAAFFALYAPVRFGLDFLRTGDATYAGLTPAQYLAIGATLAALTWIVRTRPRTG